MDNFFRDILIAELHKVRTRTLSTIDGWSRERLLWYPPGGPVANPTGFLFWHMARREDMHLQDRVQQQDQLWRIEGWDKCLGLDPEETGFGFTAAQVRDFPLPPLAELTAYYNRVRDATLAYLEATTDAALLGPMPALADNSIGVYLLARVTHEHEQWGQIDYLNSIIPPGT